MEVKITMEMVMVVATSLRTSDRNEERHKHATGESEMAIETNSSLYLQTGHQEVQEIGNNMAYKGGEGIIGNESSHRRQILRFTGSHWCLSCLLRVNIGIHEATLGLPKAKALGVTAAGILANHSLDADYCPLPPCLLLLGSAGNSTGST